MKKGQISLDLMLAVVIAIIVITAFGTVIASIKQNQEQQLVRQQLVSVTEDTANLITASQSLSDSNFVLQLAVRKIDFVDSDGTSVSKYPAMRTVGAFLDSNITFSSGKTIDYNSAFYAGPNTILDLSTPGLVVIRND